MSAFRQMISQALVKNARLGHRPGSFIASRDQLPIFNREYAKATGQAVPDDNLHFDLGGNKEAVGVACKNCFVFKVATKQPVSA